MNKKIEKYLTNAFLVIIFLGTAQVVYWNHIMEEEPMPIIPVELTQEVKASVVVEPEVWSNEVPLKATTSKEMKKLAKREISSDELCNSVQCKCLAYNIYHEARGESEIGQIAVAKVTLNRVKDKRYDSNVCDVVRDPMQFSWTMLSPQRKWRIEDKTAWESANSIAHKMISKQLDYDIKAVHYHTGTVKPKWSRSMNVERVIGNHIFFVEKS